MPLSVKGSSSSAAARKRRGDTWFDVSEWGGRPGDTTDGSVDNALEAIRNYILNVRDVGVNPKTSEAVIYFPGDTDDWYLQRPFFVERGNWEVRGAGRETARVTNVAGNLMPCFIFGMPRAPQDPKYKAYDGHTPLTLDASHWVDCYGILDGFAATSAGKRWGLRFKNDSNLSCPMTPFSHGIGDGWSLTRQMTVDFCITPGAGLQLATGPLFGMGNIGGGISYVSPWQFAVVGTNLVRFTFRTTGSNQPANQYVQFSPGATTGLMKITFQIDLVNAKAWAWCNGLPLAVTISNPTAFQAANGMSFVRNDYFPFNVGKTGATVVNQSDPATVDHTYFGLQICNRLVYKDDRTNPQLRDTEINGSPGSAGATITDLNRYFDSVNAVAYLTLTDPPPGDAKHYNDGRVVSISGGNKGNTHGSNFTAAGYFLSTCINPTPINTTRNRISDIAVTCKGPVASGINGTQPGAWMTPFGSAIAVGAVWEMYATNVTANGAGHGIGSLNAGAVFTNYIDDCWLSGGDAAYYGYWQIVDSKRVLITQGRAGVRLAASAANMEDLTMGDAGLGTDAGVYIHYGQYGGQYTFTNFNYDNEKSYGPKLAAIVWEGSDAAPSYLQINNLNIGRLPDPCVAVWVRDANITPSDFRNPTGLSSPRRLTIDGMSIFGFNHTAQIRTDGTLTYGEIKNLQNSFGTLAIVEAVPTFDHTGPGGLGRIVRRHRDYVMPPRGGQWTAGGNVLDMQLPMPGQCATLRCVRSGTMNTANPPLWDGADVLDDGAGTVSAMGIQNTYFAAVSLTS